MKNNEEEVNEETTLEDRLTPEDFFETFGKNIINPLGRFGLMRDQIEGKRIPGNGECAAGNSLSYCMIIFRMVTVPLVMVRLPVMVE